MQTELESLAPDFLKYVLMSPDVQAQIHSLATGATVQGIKARLLKQVKIASPSLIAQRRIAEHLDTAYSAAKALETRYKAKARTCEEMRTSLLATAFTGQLTNASAVAA